MVNNSTKVAVILPRQFLNDFEPTIKKDSRTYYPYILYSFEVTNVIFVLSS